MENSFHTKVTAYITRIKDRKLQLLTMIEHGVEDYGLQVPGGTLMEGETMEEALLREIYEESSLTNVQIREYLGECNYYLEKTNKYIKRHYFHLTVKDCADEFTVKVQSEDEDNGWIYHFQWIDINCNDHLPVLGGHLGNNLHKLKMNLHISG